MHIIDPVLIRCIVHGFILLIIKACYLGLHLLFTAQTCEWVALTGLAWFCLDSWWLWNLNTKAETGLVHLIDKCEASVAAVRDLTMRYEAIDRRCQALTLKQFRARDSNIREMNWMAFCRRVICLEHVRVARKGCQLQRPASDGSISNPEFLARTHSFA